MMCSSSTSKYRHETQKDSYFKTVKFDFQFCSNFCLFPMMTCLPKGKWRQLQDNMLGTSKYKRFIGKKTPNYHNTECSLQQYELACQEFAGVFQISQRAGRKKKGHLNFRVEFALSCQFYHGNLEPETFMYSIYSNSEGHFLVFLRFHFQSPLNLTIHPSLTYLIST